MQAAILGISLYLPGHFLARRLARKGDGLAELILLRVAVSLALAGPALVALALAGWFKTPVIAGCLAVISVGAFFIGRGGEGQGRRSGWDIGALGLVVGSFALYARPAEYVINSRDPGVYTLFAEKLARTGALISRDPLVGAVAPFHAFVEAKKYPGFYILGRDWIVPQFFPGPFAWLGLGDLAGGTWGLLYVVPVMGALAVGMAFALGSQLFERWAGLLGAALLAASYTQVWWARHPSSEVMTQLLLLAGLWMAARFAREPDRMTGVLAGLLLGGAMLVRVDAFLAALALPLLFGYDLLTRGDARRWLWPGVPLAVSATLALLYLNTLGGRYLYTIYSQHGLDRVVAVAGYLIAAAILAVVALFVVRAKWGERTGRWVTARGGGLALVVALIVAGVVLWAYFVLPVPWDSLPDGSRDYNAYRTQILLRLTWFTTPAVALLGLIGFVLAASRPSAGRIIVLGAFLSFGVLYTVVPNVSPDLPWATRRFVPVVFPVLCLLAGHAVAELGRFLGHAGYRRVGFVAAGALTGLALGWTVYTALPVIRFQELQGAVRAFDHIERKVPESDVVFMEMPDGYDITASTFEYAYGHPLLPYDHDRFRDEVDELAKAGLLKNAVYITVDGGPAPLVSDVDFREVADAHLTLPRLAAVEKELPTKTETLRLDYRIFRVENEK
ncbi:MAG TPA: glycosyltransferase family 39 protein [Rubrobacteraceae bacterium]|nr:glycosyltransferase family 39 protein [Rubrobacteraceae bacterium]